MCDLLVQRELHKLTPRFMGPFPISKVMNLLLCASIFLRPWVSNPTSISPRSKPSKPVTLSDIQTWVVKYLKVELHFVKYFIILDNTVYANNIYGLPSHRSPIVWTSKFPTLLFQISIVLLSSASSQVFVCLYCCKNVAPCGTDHIQMWFEWSEMHLEFIKACT